ncbi:MAG: helix-turn-helix transcriptional regulator [Acutalibacteraceae bacterium]|nr:helix-turn-helix transcriptional regulator [Acutalibacteraceae bacterium]
MNYCKRLYDLRTDNDLLQEDIAKVLGITKQAYGRYEKGTRKLSIEDLKKLCEFYNVSADYIIGLTNITKPNWKQSKIKNNVIITGGNNNIKNIKIK